MSTSIKARNETIAQMFKAGKTMPEIGELYGMSRQNVQQILQKMKIYGGDGGRAYKRSLNPIKTPEERLAEIDKRHVKAWGCTRDEFNNLKKPEDDGSSSPYVRYIQQRNNVRKQERMEKLPPSWFLNLKEWWTIWQESGHYLDRGRCSDAYCLTRKDRSKPYTADNCIIMTIADNIRASRSFYKETGYWGPKPLATEDAAPAPEPVQDATTE